MMKAKLILIVFLLAFTIVLGFQKARAASVDAYDTVPGVPLTISFGSIDASTDYHLCPDATLAWEADPGSWEITVYYDSEGDQAQVPGGQPNEGALLSVAIGFELDDAAAAASPPTDANYGDEVTDTYKIIRLGSVLKHILADGAGGFEDIGSRPFVLAVRTKDGGAFDGDYAGTITFDLDDGL